MGDINHSSASARLYLQKGYMKGGPNIKTLPDPSLY